MPGSQTRTSKRKFSILLIKREMIRSCRKKTVIKKKRREKKRGKFLVSVFPFLFFYLPSCLPLSLSSNARAARVVSRHDNHRPRPILLRPVDNGTSPPSSCAPCSPPLPFWFQARMFVCSVVRVGVFRARASAAHPRDYTMCREYGDEYIALCVLVRCVRSSVEYIYARSYR